MLSTHLTPVLCLTLLSSPSPPVERDGGIERRVGPERPTSSATATGPAGVQVGPSDVFARVALLRRELELIRNWMGRPREERPEIGVTNAAPREVFFQAVTLFRKVDRLGFEQLRENAPVPEPPPGAIGAAEVLAVVDSALGRLRRVKQGLGITERVDEPAAESGKTSTDVFRAIVSTNRQLNRLLDRRFGSSDVYQQVTLAIGYASGMLARFPHVRRIPDPPAFEPAKRPADVYARLVECFERTRHIAERLDLDMLRLEVAPGQIENVTPSDVYDVASLLVSELAYLHRRSGSTESPPDTYYPGRKLPAHVYQRVGILEAQLVKLQGQLGADGSTARPPSPSSGSGP